MIAVAGPAVSLALAVIFWLLKPVTAAIAPAFALVEYLAYINALLVVFNLIPGFPLDGGRVFRAIVWALTGSFRRATVVAAAVGRFIGFAFIFFGVWQIFGGNLINGMWIAFIGWFLESAGRAQVVQLQYRGLQAAIAGHKVSEIMDRNYPQVAADATLAQVVDSHVLGGGRRSFVVAGGDGLAGLLTLHRIKDVPREQWPATSVAQAMIPAGQVKRVAPDAGLWDALREMDADGVNQTPRDGRRTRSGNADPRKPDRFPAHDAGLAELEETIRMPTGVESTTSRPHRPEAEVLQVVPTTWPKEALQ